MATLTHSTIADTVACVLHYAHLTGSESSTVRRSTHYHVYFQAALLDDEEGIYDAEVAIYATDRRNPSKAIDDGIIVYARTYTEADRTDVAAEVTNLIAGMYFI